MYRRHGTARQTAPQRPEPQKPELGGRQHVSSDQKRRMRLRNDHQVPADVALDRLFVQHEAARRQGPAPGRMKAERDQRQGENRSWPAGENDEYTRCGRGVQAEDR